MAENIALSEENIRFRMELARNIHDMFSKLREDVIIRTAYKHIFVLTNDEIRTSFPEEMNDILSKMDEILSKMDEIEKTMLNQLKVQ